MAVLICPSDGNTDPVVIQPNSATPPLPAIGWSFNLLNNVPPPGVWYQQYSSYGGSAGTIGVGYNNTFLNQTNGAAEFAMYNGVIYNDSRVNIPQITDGTSNTFLFGEHSHFNMIKFDPQYGASDNSWNSGRWYDTMFATYFAPNQAAPVLAPGGVSIFGQNNYYYPTMASSQHPGGANFGFCDGSVRFIKNSISTWQFSTNKGANSVSLPNGVTYSNFVYTINPGTFLGVYQALSTRGFGEIVSADAF
jgi:prepilin-type processing-associated H-X9-DG protein